MERPLLDRILGRLAAAHAAGISRRFLGVVARATDAQDRILAELLRRHADSDFGREHGFARIKCYADLKNNVPVRTYEGFAPYIERMLEGRGQALLRPNEKILMFALTSGTTADPKYIPITKRVLADTRRGWNIWGVKAILDHPGSIVRDIVQVTSPMDDHVALSGVPCGAISGLLAETQKRVVRRYYTSPLAVARIRDAEAKYYTIMRLAIPRNVGWIVTANPSTLLVLARTADAHRRTLIRDIHDGTLSADFHVDGAIRDALAPRLKANPACARRLERIVSEHGAMFPKHYWNLGFRAHWCGGTMGLYEPQFPKYYGDVPARDIGLVASEGRMSIPIEDGTASGVLAVTSQFFEFIPAEEYHTDHPTTLRSHEVTRGREYFLLLTNGSGLYRYDLGDRVRVTGWLGQAPVIEFLSRDAHTSSMAGEKLTEDQVVTAIRRVFENLETSKCRNVETSKSQKVKKSKLQGNRGSGHRFGRAPDDAESLPLLNAVLSPRWADVPRYRLYVEAASARHIDRLPERFEEALCEINVEYAQKRSSLRLKAVELFELPEGALAARDLRLRKDRAHTAEQFKHQYLLARPGLDRELEQAPPAASS